MAVLNGTKDADQLYGTSDDDTFNGFEGNDWFYMGYNPGIDEYHGGAGTDFLSLTGGAVSVSRLVLNAEASVEVIDFAETYLSGTGGNDYFDLSGVYDLIERTAINLRDGDDTFIGSKDDDFVSADGATGRKTIDGREGDDGLGGGQGNDVIIGGAGNDGLAGRGGNNKLDGGSGNDIFYINNPKGHDEYYGGSGYDTVVFESTFRFGSLSFSKDVSVEEVRSDFAFEGTGGNDRFDISGFKKVTVLYVFNEGSQYYLKAGDDVFVGGKSDDSVEGGDGADSLTGAGGKDKLSGGAGDDLISGGEGNDFIDGGIGTDIMDGGAGDDLLWAANVIDGDVIKGGEGLDTLNLGQGPGVAHKLTLNAKSGVEIVDAAENTGVGTAQSDYIDFSGVAIMRAPELGAGLGRGNDVYIGCLGIDFVLGEGGDDDLSGRNGNDIMRGGTGNDSISGDRGNDILSGNNGNDQISGGSGLDRLSGGSGDDKMSGGTANDVLDGGSGDDTIYGGEGNDEITGGDNDDYLDGGAGNDVFVLNGFIGSDKFVGGSGHNIIRLKGLTIMENFSLDDNANIPVFDCNNHKVFSSNSANILDFSKVKLINIHHQGFNLFAGDDQYLGSASRDIVDGGSGNDFLDGGLGNDQLTGGDGLDFFIFETTLNAKNNVDLITDFNAVQDTIVLSSGTFSGISELGQLSEKQFAQNKSGLATDTSDRIIVSTKTGNIYYDADGRGGADGILFASIGKNTHVEASDFYII